MVGFIQNAIDRNRTIFLLLALIFVAGVYSYIAIPKEDNPDIPIPMAYVSIHHEGISPEDAVNLLVKPMEQELRGIEGLDYIEANAYEGGANLSVRFLAGLDVDKAINDVRDKVDIAKAELPTEADEPVVRELNMATFPILTVILSGDLPERTMKRVAEDLQDRIESIGTVLEAPINGIREEQVVVEVDLAALQTYGVTPQDIAIAVQNNNQLVAAGSLQLERGTYALKVPGLFRSATELMNLPVVVQGEKTIRLRDLGTIRMGFKDTTSISRVNGERALTIDIKKRTGENVIETVNAVKEVVADDSQNWPKGMSYSYTGDASEDIRIMLSDLQNSVVFSVILVMIVVLAAMGPRSAFLVATAIPGSFLMAMMVLYGIGMSTNVVVLFALILSVGMLVDGAIVVVELADTKLRNNWHRRDAFTYAAKYMAWPIIASTATTLAAFLPLIFWPGMVGEFMKFLPLTLIFTLTASLLMALVFLPTIGSTLGKRPKTYEEDFFERFAKKYGTLLRWSLQRPGKILSATVAGFFGVIILYGIFGAGVEFFPNIEPKRAMIKAHLQGDYSISEKDAIMQRVGVALADLPDTETVYINTGNSQKNANDDVIGSATLVFMEHQYRTYSVEELLAQAEERLQNISGVRFETEKEQGGPREGKPISIALKANSYAPLEPVAKELRKHLEEFEGTYNVDDSLPDPGIEWNIAIDRSEAIKSGTNLATVGSVLRMATNGFIMGTYRPEDSNDELDIVARLPESQRTLSTIDNLTLLTDQGRMPLSHFTEREAKPKVSVIERLDQKMVVYVEADVRQGYLANDIVQGMRTYLDEHRDLLPQGVEVEFRGDDEQMKESEGFLLKAFAVAIFIMAIILVTQFNSFYQAFIILSAVILSTAGVLLGHLITHKPFGVVMSGLGVIALAGIVVNNNIVLIDTFNKLKEEMADWKEALIETGVSRLRPVMLTAITTAIGLLPMALKINVDLTGRSVDYNTPSTQWWDQLASAIIFGLTFATVLTLVITPCMIAAAYALSDWKQKRKERAAHKIKQLTQ